MFTFAFISGAFFVSGIYYLIEKPEFLCPDLKGVYVSCTVEEACRIGPEKFRIDWEADTSIHNWISD